MTTPLYPLFADLGTRRVLVVGGGRVAQRKVEALRKAGAEVVVGAPTLTPTLSRLAREGEIVHLHGRFDTSWLSETWIVVAATGRKSENAAVARAAAANCRLVNVVDDADLSSFHVPASVVRGDLHIAISSAGHAPAIARRLRAQLELWLDRSWAGVVALARRNRSLIRTRLPTLKSRRAFFDWLLDGPVATLLRHQREADAARTLRDALDRPETWRRSGRVSLTGAGPGDPGLLTLNALRALHQADVILHDRLVSSQVLDLARRDAERIAVGKQPGADGDASQHRIHCMMAEYVRRGLHVVRLKGGDPFIFGRGGEEAEFLRQRGIDYEIIPGLTAASACASYAGIPLTHRDHAQSVRLVTAHCKHSLDTLDWHSLAAPRQTLAVYMGVARLPELSRKLLAHGCDAATPVALIENGSRTGQRVVHGRLRELPELAVRNDIRPPAMLIIGQVAALGQTLAWFDRCSRDLQKMAQAA